MDAKEILYQSVMIVKPSVIESLRVAYRSGIRLSEVKAMIRKAASKEHMSRGVMPGALIAAAEVVYEQERKAKKK